MRSLFLYKLKYNGLNFSNFLNFLLKNNIKILNIEMKNNKEIFFTMSSGEYKKLKKIKSPYKLTVVKYGGVNALSRLVISRIGMVIGISIVLIVSSIIGSRTMYVNVVGTTSSVEKIKESVLNYGIKLGKVNKFNNQELEKYLLSKVDNISLVSVKTKGNAIIINVVEKNNCEEGYQPLYSPYNIVIKEVKLISGTLNIDKDSVVKRGSVLVEPYTINANGERINVEAKTTIVADVWFCGSESVNKQLIYYNKTGNKKVFSKLLFNNVEKCEYVSPYDNYMTETCVINITNKVFLPIYLQKTIYYETEKIVENFNLENNKNQYLEKSKQKAYDILPDGVIINEEIQNITELEDRYIFQTYLKTTMEISNED